MYNFLVLLFMIDCLLLMVVILLQDSKGEGLSGAFGGGGGMATQVLGGRGAATFLSRATTYLGTAFLGLCIIMAMMKPTSVGSSRSVILDEPAAQGEQAIPQTGLPLLPGTSATTPPPATTGSDTGGTGD